MPTKQVSRTPPRAAPRSRTDGELAHGLLPGLVGYQLRLAQLAVFRDFEVSTVGLGLTPGRFGMLVLIEANPGVTQSGLARAVGLADPGERACLGCHTESTPSLVRFEYERKLPLIQHWEAPPAPPARK